jgi:hypothetical protein
MRSVGAGANHAHPRFFDMKSLREGSSSRRDAQECLWVSLVGVWGRTRGMITVVRSKRWDCISSLTESCPSSMKMVVASGYCMPIDKES